MSSTSHQPDPKDVLHEVLLGAATGDDAHLKDRLGTIARAINEDTPPTWGHALRVRLIDLLGYAKSFLPKAATWTSETIREGVSRFTRIEIERIKAKAEADALRVRTEAEAHALRRKAEAEADLTKAQAVKVLTEVRVAAEQSAAEAQETLARTRRKDQLFREMLRSGIACQAEFDDKGEITRVVFTKKGTDSRTRPAIDQTQQLPPGHDADKCSRRLQTDGAPTEGIGTRADPKSSSAFLSYSHDSDDHAERVAELADALRTNGIDVILDQYVHPAPDEGWPRWMERNLDAADFVLMVCTATYLRRVMGEEKLDHGLGVRWEGKLIYNRIYHDPPRGSRFIAILLLPGSERAHIPSPVQGHAYYRIATFDLTDPGYEGLYRHLTGQAPMPPPELGTISTLAPKPRRGSPPNPR
ncbi:MAG: TIR domain-containing protein [Planctomycetaceae bacterium]|nr:TIR domain-containing protein [Planctomycetaceae bacterium]